MKGWITKTVGKRPFKAWAWNKSIFTDCKITFHATRHGAINHLREIGAETITDESEVRA